MSFIPIDAKADLEGQKKGKLTPAQHAVLNAYCLTKETGVLDFDLPSTSAVGLSIKSRTVKFENGKAEIEFNRGFFVVNGRFVECEEGTTVTITPSDPKNGIIVARFDLSKSGTQEFEIAILGGTNELSIPVKQDLNQYPQLGKHEFWLFKYSHNSIEVTVDNERSSHDKIPKVSSIATTVQSHKNYFSGFSGNLEERLGELSNRLDTLGFKKGSVTTKYSDGGSNNISSGVTLTKMGKYAILKYSGNDKIYGSVDVTMSDGFVSKDTFDTRISNKTGTTTYAVYFKKGSNIVTVDAFEGEQLYPFQIGFEVQ